MTERRPKVDKSIKRIRKEEQQRFAKVKEMKKFMV
jgi:hypothetical protein